jgi:hypothetical protein
MTKTSKANKASSKKTTPITLHIATPGTGKPLCGAAGKGVKNTLTPADATCIDCQKIAAHAEEKAKNEAKEAKAETKAAEKPETKKAAKPAAEPRERDPRLPPPGTTIKKLDRAGGVRAEVKVTETGFIYQGEEFRSLSGAAMAAAKDLDIKGAVNGYLFWGLQKQAPRVTDPVEALEAAWNRYHERLKAIAASELEAPVRTKLASSLDRQGREIIELGAAL